MGLRFGAILEELILRAIGIERELPLQIDITNACNLDCSHCYHSNHENKNTLSFSQWLQVLNQYDSVWMKMGYTPSLIICGGEPLTSPNLFPLLNELLKRYEQPNRRFRLSILTNGTLVSKISPGNVGLLKKFSNLTFQVSLDGPTPQTHDHFRGDGNFTRAIKGIKTLIEQGFSVHTLTVLSRQNETYIGPMFRLAKELGVSEHNFTRIIEIGKAKENFALESGLNPSELQAAYRKILVTSSETQVPTNLQRPLMHLIQPGLGRNGRFFEGLVVDHQGNILASSRSRLKLGHVFTEGLAEVFYNNPILKKIRFGEIEKCGPCEYSKICGGDRNAAFAATGNYLGADPGCWLDFKKVD